MHHLYVIAIYLLLFLAICKITDFEENIWVGLKEKGLVGKPEDFANFLPRPVEIS